MYVIGKYRIHALNMPMPSERQILRYSEAPRLQLYQLRSNTFVFMA